MLLTIQTGPAQVIEWTSNPGLSIQTPQDCSGGRCRTLLPMDSKATLPAMDTACRARTEIRMADRFRDELVRHEFPTVDVRWRRFWPQECQTQNDHSGPVIPGPFFF